MVFRCIWMSLLFVFVLLQPSSLFGHGSRQRPQSAPTAQPTKPLPGPRELRAERERAVAFIGASGREFVERYGEDAVAAIFACSKAVALRLVEFHISGGLHKLPEPRSLLRVIAQPKHGDEVASWAIGNAKELIDIDRFDAYLADPLVYALALKKLEDGVAEVRKRRQQAQNYYKALANAQATRSAYSWRMFTLGVGVTVVVLLIVRRLRESNGQNPRWI